MRSVSIRAVVVALTVLLLAAMTGLAAAQDGIDFQRARALRQRAAKGEKLSAEEQAYLDRAIQARRTAGRPVAGARPQDRAGVKSVSELKPLCDMTAEERYKGEDGGLYGGGKNEPPQEHLAAAIRAAVAIQPLNAAGQPAADGKIALISVGMSNTTQEFSAFERLAAESSNRSRSLVTVDGAQGGMDAAAWARPDESLPAGRLPPFDTLAKRVRGAGVSPQQVQVVWIKQALKAPARFGAYPKHAEQLAQDNLKILQELKQRYPNLRIAYLSGRIYAGYGPNGVNPEPYAYESAFAVRSLIQRQIKGDAGLNYDPERGPVKSPLVLWGPYLWANGEEGRKLDDLKYTRTDLGADGIHPSETGRRKVAEELLEFFETDATANPWFRAK